MSTIDHIVLPLSEKFQEVILDQQGAAQYAHNFEDRSSQLEVVLNNGDKTVGDNCDVNLYTHGILAVTPETLDTEMLLDPLEKKLDLPATTIKQCDVFSGKVEVVGVVHKGTSKVFGIIDNPSQFCRVVPCIVFPGKSDCLVEEYTILPVKHFVTVNNLECRFPFLPNDEECSAEMYSEEPCEIEIPTVKYIAGVGFVVNPVHSLVVADIGVGDSVEYRDLCDDINLCVYFDARLCTAEKSPSENRHAEIDDSGINGIEPPVEFKLFGDSPMLSKRYHIERELLEYSRLSEHICFGKGVPDHCRVAESKLITPFSMGGCDICKFSERSASEQLSKNEDKQVIPMRKTPILCPVIEFGYNSAKLPLRQIHCDLGEYVSSVVHLCFFLLKTKVRNSSPGQYFSSIIQCA